MLKKLAKKNKLKAHVWSKFVIFKHPGFFTSFCFSLVLLGISLVVNFYAGTFATMHASSAVTDIVLDNIRVFDVDGIFVYGSILMWMFIISLLVIEPRRTPFTLKSIALFVIIRSVFVTLTHIGRFPTHVALSTTNPISDFTFGGDLFFSGHTGLPFLMALIFWKNKYLRILFICTSVLFAFVVLMGHLHYSIDVLGAFFITFTIHHIASRFFAKDEKIFSGRHLA